MKYGIIIKQFIVSIVVLGLIYYVDKFFFQFYEIIKVQYIKIYFKLFNSALFDSKLSPFGQVEIKDLKRQKCIGQVVVLEWKRAGTRLYKLEMLPSYPNKKDFLDTLIHEMVHLYQMQNLGDTGNHNDLFWSFEPKVNYIGLRL